MQAIGSQTGVKLWGRSAVGVPACQMQGDIVALVSRPAGLHLPSGSLIFQKRQCSTNRRGGEEGQYRATLSFDYVLDGSSLSILIPHGIFTARLPQIWLLPRT